MLGPTLTTYQDRGYKDFVFGQPYEEVHRRTPLKYQAVNPTRFTTSDRRDDLLAFDRDRRLVLYGKTYDGGADDHLDRIVGTFGKAQPERVRTTQQKGLNAVTDATVLHYAFPKVLVQVQFTKTRSVAMGQVRTKEATWVGVADREWVEWVLLKNLADKRRCLAWVKGVTDRSGGRKVDPGTIPNLPGATRKDESDDPLVGVTFHDDHAEGLNRKQKEAGEFPVPTRVASVTCAPADPLDASKVSVRVGFDFHVYRPVATEPLHQQDLMPVGRWADYTTNALGYTPFADLVGEVNVALVREYYRPASGKVTVVTPATGPRYTEWRTTDGWLVRVSGADTFSVEWGGKK